MSKKVELLTSTNARVSVASDVGKYFELLAW